MNIMSRWRVVKTQGPIAKEHMQACFCEAAAIIANQSGGQVVRSSAVRGRRVLATGLPLPLPLRVDMGCSGGTGQ